MRRRQIKKRLRNRKLVQQYIKTEMKQTQNRNQVGISIWNRKGESEKRHENKGRKACDGSLIGRET
jgi:hypothetical protein